MEELAFTPLEEVAAIEGFDDNIAGELIRRARRSSRAATRS
ncbi:MAG: hypothetical protein WDN25_17085 [Acetobacteraceae bacterium]